MGAKANLVSESTKMVFGLDSVVIRQFVGGITGGATLDTTDFKGDVIQAGHLVSSKPANEPLVGVMDCGRVNDKAMPYPLTSEMRTAIKTALPNLIFEHD